jgi:hypothetical protein
MAEFSKQWCEANDPEMPWDFDLDKEFQKLGFGEWMPLICEGYGFVGIQKLLDGTKQCVFKNYQTGKHKEIDYNKLTSMTHKDVWIQENGKQ